ncbi:hypothetical protein RHA1_ro10244 (plasmid) [Rhodococcus jostii RHA1]|uniref:Uncharacterized protein n=1 Tax=Rhodococcus jostii (strain RHA1) TaxID=101510 RepID=Q0RW99_RHOJR|nr:hypothetical protein RHA1_ro10244 [Rhodococcus jostii RHA1]
MSVDSVRLGRTPTPAPSASSADLTAGRAHPRIPTSSRCGSPDQRDPQRPIGPEPAHARIDRPCTLDRTRRERITTILSRYPPTPPRRAARPPHGRGHHGRRMRPGPGYRWRRAALHWAPLVVAVVGVFAGMREGGSLFDTVFYLFLGAPSTHRLLLALRQVRASVPDTSIEPPPCTRSTGAGDRPRPRRDTGPKPHPSQVRVRVP